MTSMEKFETFSILFIKFLAKKLLKNSFYILLKQISNFNGMFRIKY